MIKLFPLIILLSLTLYSQENTASFEEDLQHAFVNAKKGMYYALNNIPESKSSLNQDLIESDKLIAEIKLSKETNGVKVESTGYHLSYSVKVVIYRSYDSLTEDGYR